MDEVETCLPPNNEWTVNEWADYVVVLTVLVGACIIGLFVSWSGPKLVKCEDFLLGGSSLPTFPASLSLCVGFITAIEILGNPAEMYYNGTQYSMIVVSFFLVVPLTSYFYLPVFRKLHLTSCYEYLELRFNKFCRGFASALCFTQTLLYTSVAVYAPALALSRVTGLNVYLAVTVVYIICMMYSTLGGLRAVIMADTFLAPVLLVSEIVVAAEGSYRAGGVFKLIEYLYKSDRAEFFIIDPDPTVRHSFWSVVVGGTFYWATLFCVNQATIQKYLSVNTIQKTRKCLWTSGFGLLALFGLNFFTGAILYAEYKDCDPYENQEIHSKDEILPLFVMNVQGQVKGVRGLFVAGVLASSIGTVAAAISALAAITIKDLIQGMIGITIKEDRGASLCKWLSLFFGLISLALVFIVEKLGSVLEAAISFNGMTGGVTLGLFTLGMFCPWANAKGAAVGGVVSLSTVTWMGFGAEIVRATTGSSTTILKPISMQGCPCFDALLPAASDQEPVPQPMWMYRVSYMWYSAIGFLVTIIVGVLVSGVTKFQKPFNVDHRLLSPPIVDLMVSLPRKWKQRLCIAIVENGTTVELREDRAQLNRQSPQEKGSRFSHTSLASLDESPEVPVDHFMA